MPLWLPPKGLPPTGRLTECLRAFCFFMDFFLAVSGVKYSSQKCLYGYHRKEVFYYKKRYFMAKMEQEQVYSG